MLVKGELDKVKSTLWEDLCQVRGHGGALIVTVTRTGGLHFFPPTDTTVTVTVDTAHRPGSITTPGA